MMREIEREKEDSREKKEKKNKSKVQGQRGHEDKISSARVMNESPIRKFPYHCFPERVN